LKLTEVKANTPRPNYQSTTRRSTCLVLRLDDQVPTLLCFVSVACMRTWAKTSLFSAFKTIQINNVKLVGFFLHFQRNAARTDQSTLRHDKNQLGLTFNFR